MERRLAAILVADIAGYSKLMHADEDATLAALLLIRKEVADPKVAEHSGRIFKHTGDGFLAEFSSALNAVRCAIALQDRMSAHAAGLPNEKRITFRIGVNLADVVEELDDVYGDGVNIAARLESIAEPGGVCISGDVYHQVHNKIDQAFEDLGEIEIKNIAEPVRVFKLAGQGGATAARSGWRARRKPLQVVAVGVLLALLFGAVLWQAPLLQTDPLRVIESAQRTSDTGDANGLALTLPDKPSIAVLPFANTSNDAEQEYFVDGMTEDLITNLSKMSGLFVISRNSSFAYKDKAVESRQVASALGVRYLLEGSVRRAGDQVRVNVQLIDATTGGQLWADRYDDRLDNVFSLQDRITDKIFSALAVKLDAGEQASRNRQETNNIKAYDEFLKGWENYRKWTAHDFQKALPYFERAIELDPDYGRAHAAIASIYTESYQNAWDWSHVVGVSAEAMPGLAGGFLKDALLHPTPLAHQVASKWYIILLFPDEAVSEAARGIALDPNDAAGYLAMSAALIYSGKPDEAVEFVDKAIRADPHNMPNYLFTLGMAHFGMEQFEDAVSVFERAFKLNPQLGLVQRAYLAASYEHLGLRDKAVAELKRPEIDDVRELYDLYVKYEGAYYKNESDSTRLLGALRDIGQDQKG